MFHFGLPSEKLTFPEDYFVKRYEKLLYFGSGGDILPLPIAKTAVYVDVTKQNISYLTKEAEKLYSFSKEPKIVHSQDGSISEVVFTWGNNPPLTRYVKK